MEGIRVIRGQKLTVTSDEKVLMEIDGETGVYLPVEITLLPRQLKLLRRVRP